jgi:hypothetical protein
VEDEASCEWPLTSTKNENAEKLWQLNHQDAHLIIHDLCKNMNLSYRNFFIRRSERTKHLCKICFSSANKWRKGKSFLCVL